MMGLIDSLLEKAKGGRCYDCGHLVQIGKNGLGCRAHDKLIIPEYPPYSYPAVCPDWKEREEC